MTGGHYISVDVNPFLLPYNLIHKLDGTFYYKTGRINALHSQLDLFMKKEMLNMPATKYLDLYLYMFWWLQKNKSLSILEMHNRLSKILFGMVSNERRAKMSSIPVLQLVDRQSPVDISKVFS